MPINIEIFLSVVDIRNRIKQIKFWALQHFLIVVNLFYVYLLILPNQLSDFLNFFLFGFRALDFFFSDRS
jgi:predicted transcriptional regulator